MLASWNDLTKEIKLPTDIMIAVSTNRKELLGLASRDMKKAEVNQLLNLIGVLLDTNYELQEHSRELAKRMKELKGNFQGLSNSIEKCCDYANFQTESLRSGDDE